MFNLKYASTVKSQYSAKSVTLYTERSQSFQIDWNPFLSSEFHNDWLQNHCWLYQKYDT